MLESQTNCFTWLAWDGTGMGTTPQSIVRVELDRRSTDNPNFEEATQTAAYLLILPICILGFWIRTASGLSQQWVYHGSD